MILHEFPDLQWLKGQAKSGFENRKGANGIKLSQSGWPTVILNTATRQVIRDNIPGPLSIFTNVRGTSTITTGGRRVQVSEDRFIISNCGQSYTLEIDEQKPVETFNVHIGDQFAKHALQSFFLSAEQLLEGKSADGSFGFHNRLIESSPEFISISNAIRNSENDKLALDENLYRLTSFLVLNERNMAATQMRITATKKSTKDEILKRLLMASDYLYTYYTTNPDLDELARVSCMSKFHFLRLFKIAFGITPHQFITAQKIKKAKEILKDKKEIGAIAIELGFDTTSSFSRTFRKQVGVYPSDYRIAIKS